MSIENEDVIVKIFGNEFCIKGDRKYIQKLAQYVDNKMREIDSTAPFGSSTKVAIYTSFQIANELFQQEKELENIEEKIGKKTSKMVKILQEALKD
ncbi:MAG: cell division protein ZapA [bacterium]